jgi:hypothetical protein
MFDGLHEMVGKQIDDLLQQCKFRNFLFYEEEASDGQHDISMEESPIFRQDMMLGLPCPAKQLYALLGVANPSLGMNGCMPLEGHQEHSCWGSGI